MQIMLDLSRETAPTLRLVAQFVLDYATALEQGVAPPREGPSLIVPEDAHQEVPPVPTAGVPPVPAAPSQPVPSNVIPLVPNVPQAATPAPAAPVAQQLTPLPDAQPQELLFDSSGMPWDARIHQKGHSVKKDGTWKLKKGIDENLVVAVTQQNAHLRRPPGAANTPATVGAPAPVSLPQTQAMPQVPAVPPIPAVVGAQTTVPQVNHQGQAVPQGYTPHAQQTQAPAQVQTPQAVTLPAASAVQLPQQTSVGLPDATGQNVVPVVGGEFRAIVKKITEARASGRLTADGVAAILAQAGVPSLQLLGNMPHLIPTVDAYLDAALAVS